MSIPTEAAPQEPAAASELPSVEQARARVRRRVYWALGLGLVPLPFVDVAVLTALQLAMIAELCAMYHVSFSEQRARSIVLALATGLGSVAVAGLIAGTLFKLVPGLGIAVSVFGVPLLAGAFTHALGNLFIVHLQAGGTLLDFDVERMREHFARELERSKVVVARMQTQADEPPAP